MTEKPDRGSNSPTHESESRPRSNTFILVWALCGLLTFSGLAALGTWQVYRLGWKLDLIERVDQRVDAPSQSAPDPSQWSDINSEKDSYRHVSVTGTFLNDKSTFVKASTKLGSGFWLLTPLKRSDDSLVLINRGFVSDKIPLKPANTEDKTTIVTGLLRVTERDGNVLQDNRPADDRWYSRDVQAIADARNLSNVAPYFIDADGDGRQMISHEFNQTYHTPVGGLTVISFYNHHLLYAITWYVLALMVVAGSFWFLREERRSRRHSRSPTGG